MPNRILRDWTDSEKFNGISPQVEVLFTRLIMKADDFGRYHAHPQLVKSNLFPFSEDLRANTVAAWLTELSDRQLVFCYKSRGRELLAIINFNQRLRPDAKPKFDQPEGEAENWIPPEDAAGRGGLRRVAALVGGVVGGEGVFGAGGEGESEGGNGARSLIAEIPSWAEFWGYCQTQACLLPAEWFVKDKFEAANADQWKNKSDWRAYARRCKGWWENDGRPMVPRSNPPGGFRNGKPQLKPDHKKGF